MAYPTGGKAFRRWRVRNAEPIGDHWNIGELVFLTPSGGVLGFEAQNSENVTIKIDEVDFSANYDGHDLVCPCVVCFNRNDT